MADLLIARGLEKRFTGVVALNKVDFSLHAGEIHALMGENGAGKSTLIKVLTGVYPPDGGEVVLAGTPIHPHSPQEAVSLGISTVYQEVNLAPNLSIAENVCLGRESRGPFGIKWGEARQRARAALARLGLDLDVRTALGSQSIAIQQMVAIARALDISSKVLILDEPTSSLDRDEVSRLFGVLRRLRESGIGIVFVTHFIDQVYEIADRITVLRNGSLVGVHDVSHFSKLELVSAMIGRDAATLERQSSSPLPQPLSSAAETEQTENLVSAGEGGRRVLIAADRAGRKSSVQDVTVTLGPGETLGLGGLLGSGRTEVLRLFYGLDRPDQGSLTSLPAREMGFCPEDRKAEAIFPDLSVRDNLLLVAQIRRGWWRKIGPSESTKIVDEFIAKLKIATSDAEKPIRFLSGGNQQKVIFARWLAANPKVLFLDEPTRGIDVGAKFEIEGIVDGLRQSGMAFGFVSSELDEVVRWSTKVAILRDHHMVALLEGSEKTEANALEAIAG